MELKFKEGNLSAKTLIGFYTYLVELKQGLGKVERGTVIGFYTHLVELKLWRKDFLNL